ncbi:hypothetical protein GUJ93_ZPchr0010g8187 [Zizania palustris]|uniref:Methyltransferase domain-containing protein n=1 Tax=Zizania palustris TaxID=103762 RepID=A0A8J6BH99_ZIZPA|nr:hypothetical protein GUJ93_ZPchr0010g8187 [Zizania palustris]
MLRRPTVAAFLERCQPSGDAAYGELKALLGRLHDPAARRSARAFLAALAPLLLRSRLAGALRLPHPRPAPAQLRRPPRRCRCRRRLLPLLRVVWRREWPPPPPTTWRWRPSWGLRGLRRRGVGAAKAVLERLQAPASRADARRLLGAVRRRFADPVAGGECFRTFHFRIHDVVLGPRLQGFQQRKKLTMMEIPSIFIPEDWSFTFYEGLNRHPDSIFRDKTVAELGCGNGWISIALAEKWSPSKVYGLDINPRAVKIAWINLYLNALDDDGLPIYDGEGKTLLDRVEFYESDLLSYCRDNKIELDRIVGCIPQILNPNPEAMSKIVTENSSEEFLYSLSNYCALQGFVEDQFGLGLIARAVEEGIDVIKPMGIMAADTDISALVEIEKNSRHRLSSSWILLGISLSVHGQLMPQQDP